jgi:kynurenine formamidase
MLQRIAIFTIASGCVFAQGWQKGKGYGWTFGPNDERGAINTINNASRIKAALAGVKTGRVFDMGVPVDRTSYKWPGHSPTEVLSYRSPEGEKRAPDTNAFKGHPAGLGWHSCALFISDNVGTQIDGLGHITTGADNHWYNGFKESDHGTDFGVRKADADQIPPIIARAVMIDVAGWKGVEALPSNFAIGSKEMQAALARQKADVEPGDVVMIRTGTLRYWGASGADHAKIPQHDSAGITLEAAKWLVEQKGAVMVGSDTSGLEVGTDPAMRNYPNAVHEYLLIKQGVHIGEFHNLEGLARAGVSRFTYIGTTNRVRGAVAGFALRPIGIE